MPLSMVLPAKAGALSAGWRKMQVICPGVADLAYNAGMSGKSVIPVTLLLLARPDDAGHPHNVGKIEHAGLVLGIERDQLGGARRGAAQLLGHHLA